MAKKNTKDFVTVYSPSGKAVTGTRTNALDMVRLDGYTWNPPTPKNEKASAEAPAEKPVEQAEPEFKESADAEAERKAEPQEEPKAAEAPKEDDTDPGHAAEEEDHTELGDEAPADLADEAKTVADYDSVEAYLKTFDQAALRTILEETFGQTADGRTSKAKLIKKIIAANDEVGGEAL
jgi:hypothetical protein